MAERLRCPIDPRCPKNPNLDCSLPNCPSLSSERSKAYFGESSDIQNFSVTTFRGRATNFEVEAKLASKRAV